MKQWYESLFENYAVKYDSECYTQGTVGECDFIEQEIAHNKAARILDIGCGTGRHSIELTRRGYTVVGVDLSDSQLARAKAKASAQGLSVTFVKHDARQLPFKSKFDLVIILCEGAFPLMETDEMNFRILRGAADALKPKGKLILTTLNGLFPLFHSVKDFLAGAAKEGAGTAVSSENTFDLMTFRDRNTTTFEDDQGNKIELKCDERYYVPSEITWLLKSLEFQTVDIFSAKLGAYSRSDKLTTEDFEMLVVAEK
jgi:2-polyprenyl-3-methyl-5-hydroxy-6-metoxy-1,4-benzoquinol methylase